MMLSTTIQIPGFNVVKIIYENDDTAVYQGLTKLEGRSHIIKLLKAEQPSFREVARLKHEYEMTQRLDLDGVIKSYDLISYPNGCGTNLALILEDFSGQSLQHWIAHAKFELVDFLKIGIEVAKILGELHTQGVIHRDIKPQNILYNPQTEEVKLTDFGIASLLLKENLAIGSPNLLEGTLSYISPEQTGRMNRAVDYRTDFYSLGVTFYELLVGQLPFGEVQDPLELVHCHIAKQPLSPHQIDPSVPPVLSALVMKLLAKTAEDRYQSAYGLRVDLERCLRELQTHHHISDFLISQHDRSNQFQIPQKLYGRDGEVATLMAAFERVSQGATELLLLGGYSGVGKSALVNEIQRPIVHRGYFISGKFDQFKRNIPYASLIQAFQELMRQLLTESQSKVEKWKLKLLKALGSNGQVIVDVIPEVELIIGQQPTVPELGASESQNRFNLVFLQFIHVFTNVEHPLVLFLDDLQWADSASLKLIQRLMSDLEGKYLFLIAAYRDNEVNATHPFVLMLEELRAAGATMTTIALAPLSDCYIKALLADTLSCSSEQVQPLADLLISKTQGNPFFLTQLLNTLYQEQLLRFNNSTGNWQWDIDQIQQHSITDNVVDLMISNIQKLPLATQQALQLAACVGSRFDLHTLAIIHEKSLQETTIDLWQALQAMLIVPLSNDYKIPRLLEQSEDLGVDYRFLHDRVQQAAYLLIPDEQKQAVHLRVGQLLLQNQTDVDVEENLFEIVNHLNLGSALMDEPAEQEQLTRLNLRASRKAKSSTAYEPALRYVVAGIKLLPEACWQLLGQLTLSLYLEQIECEYIVGDFEAAEAHCAIALNQAQTSYDKSEINAIRLTHYQNSARYESAIKVGLESLRLFGIDLPYEPSQAEILLAWDRVKQQLGDRAIASLIDAPPLEDPELQTIIRLLMNLVPPTYLINQPLLGLCVLTMTSISLQHGNSLLSVFVYAWYGTVLCGNFNEYATGYEFGQLALKLNETFDTPVLNGKLYMSFGNFISHWRKHVKNNVPIQQSAYQFAKAMGDFSWCHHSTLFGFWQRFEIVQDLEISSQEHEKYINFATETELTAGLALSLQHNVLLNLAGLTLNQTSLSTDSFDEQKALDAFRQSNYDYGINTYYFSQVFVRFTFGDYTAAYAMSLEAEKTIAAINAQYQVTLHYFFQSLTLLALYPTATPFEQQQYWQVLQVNQKKLELWADNCPENFLAKLLLVQAETARVVGHYWEATDLYDRAIDAAKGNEFVYAEILATELAAKFYLSLGKDRLAHPYLKDACSGYRRWGANAKVKDLQDQHPHLINYRKSSKNFDQPTKCFSTTTTESSTNLLDLTTVIKASHAISSELVLSNLLEKLMRISLENAGAQKGCLLFENLGKLTIEVEGSVEQEEILLRSGSIKSAKSLPESIINYVMRTQESVVLNQATIEGLFTTDPYILEKQPKSVLCLPLNYQGKLISILYLENNLVSGAFTIERLEVLKILCSQTAVSIEKSRLYTTLEAANQKLEDHSRTLEQKVEARTGELKDKNEQLESTICKLQQTQAQLIQTERLSSLGQLVAGIAHEINNPISFIFGNLHPAEMYAKSLLRLLNLYQRYYPDPVDEIQSEVDTIDLDFIAQDLPKLLCSMRSGSQRIRDIVLSLRTFSRMDESGMKAVDLHENIDSTLMILQNRVSAKPDRPEIKIVRDYGKLPKVTCNAGELNQVFMSIFTNAIEALDQIDATQNPTPKISITTEVVIPQTPEKSHKLKTPPTVSIRIADNAKGMSEDVRKRLFDPFFTTKEIGKGTGLGMSISYQVVTNNHHGWLECVSSPGKGTELIIQMPIG